jgi:hypothetical protein
VTAVIPVCNLLNINFLYMKIDRFNKQCLLVSDHLLLKTDFWLHVLIFMNVHAFITVAMIYC